jgi:hypothetical protein
MLLLVPLFAPFTVPTYPAAFVYRGLVQALLLAVLFRCALDYPFVAAETAAAHV